MSETKQEKVCKVYITGDGTIFGEADLKRYEIPSSKQLDPITFRGLQVIEPPYDLTKLMVWMEISVAHAAAINAKVQDAVGIGWHLEQLDDKVNKPGKEKAEEFFNQVNENEDIIRMSKKVYLDFQGCGNGYIEVARDKDNKVSGLFQIPAQTMRLHTGKKLYVQRIAGRTVWFKKFGDKNVIDNRNGQAGKDLLPEQVANEIVHLKQYTWRSPFYGLPEWLPALYPMFAEQKEKDYNLNFFSSFGIPAYAVILKGLDFNQEVEDNIKKYFSTEVKANPHSTMVFATPTGAEIIFEKLNIERKEASFRVYRRDNRDDILTAHRVPPYRAGIVIQGQLAGGVAAETDRIYLTSVINPLQMEYEWMLTKLIMQDGLGIEGWKFLFDDLVIDEQLQKAQVHQIYLNTGVMSPNEVREDLGEEPYEGGDAYTIGAMPIGQEPNSSTDGGAGVPTDGVKPLAVAEGKPSDGADTGNNPNAIAAVGTGGGAGTQTGKQLIVLGKGRHYQNYIDEKARQRNGGHGFKIDNVANQHRKALKTEFKRQGNALVTFLTDAGILQKIHEDAKQSHPELFSSKKTKRFYETVAKATNKDREAVGKFIAGWQDKVKPASVTPILNEFAMRAGTIGGQAGLDNLGLRLDFDLKKPSMVGALKGRGEKITGDITQKTLDDFTDALVSGFYEDGDGPLEVAKNIRDLFEETYAHRAETIARTETGIAVSTVQHETYVENGVQLKRWEAFLDNKTRDAHAEADGQEVAMDEPFNVGGEELDHPLDESGSPENIINCRCVEIPVVTDVINPDEAWTGD
jgi:PBSX family phage portal protein